MLILYPSALSALSTKRYVYKDVRIACRFLSHSSCLSFHCQQDLPAAMADIEQSAKSSLTAHAKEDGNLSKASPAVGQENLAGVIPPHESYEGHHRFDPTASWSVKEEKKVIFKTDLMLMTWLCLMVRP